MAGRPIPKKPKGAGGKASKKKSKTAKKAYAAPRAAPAGPASASVQAAKAHRDIHEEPTLQLAWAAAKKIPVDPQVAIRMKISAHSELSALLRFSDLARHARTAFLLDTEEGDCDPLGSKFSGTPWLFTGEPWPSCPNCKNPMQLLAQLNLDALAAGSLSLYGNGLLQVFTCTNNDPLCEMETEAHLPGPGRSKLVRVIQPSGESQRAEVPTFPGLNGTLPPHRINGLKSIQDFPAEEDLDGKIDPILRAAKVDLARYRTTMPFEGDKLGGWPRWNGASDYPECPACREKMTGLVLQIASGGVAGWQWGDRGSAFVLQCQSHPDLVELIWQ